MRQLTSQENWPRLADYVISGRKAAGYPTALALAAATGISSRTLGKLENGQRVGKDTLATVAAALRWTPDSPRRILAGGEPVTAPPEDLGDGDVAELRALLAAHPDDKIITDVLGSQAREGKPARVIVKEILEWLDFLESRNGLPQNGESAGLPAARPLRNG